VLIVVRLVVACRLNAIVDRVIHSPASVLGDLCVRASLLVRERVASQLLGGTGGANVVVLLARVLLQVLEAYARGSDAAGREILHLEVLVLRIEP